MSLDDEPNPYAPPESDEVRNEPDAPVAPQDVWSIPGLVWERGRELFALCLETNLLWLIVGIQIVHTAVSMGPQLALGMSPSPLNQDPPQFQNFSEDMLPLFIVGFLVVWLLTMALQLLLASLARPMHRLSFEGRGAFDGLWDAVKMGASRIPHMIGVGFLVGVAYFLGLCACVLPGLVIMIGAGFPVYIVLTTDLGVIDSIKGGIEFFKRQWTAFLVGVLAFIAAYAIVACPMYAMVLIPTVGLVLWMVGLIGLMVLMIIGFVSLFCVLEKRDREMYGTAAWEQFGPQAAPQPHQQQQQQPTASEEPPSDDRDDDSVHEW